MRKQSFWKSETLNGDIEQVRRIIQKTISESSSVIRKGLETFSQTNGKMLRPAFLLIAARFGKFNPEKFYNLSAAVEMLHMATLIHDDVIDDSPLRRGNPTVHTRFGKKEAVLMGDYLLSRCFAITADFASMENASYLAKAVGHICGSEIAQAEDSCSVSVTPRRYIRRISGKTSLLFSLSSYIGAAESSCPRWLINTLTRIGYNIGMGFQIIDDIIDYTGTKDVAGKPCGSDLKEGVITLPLIYALKGAMGKELRIILSAPPYTENSIARIVELVRGSGGVEKAYSRAEEYTRRAKEEMSSLPKNTFTPVLHDMVEQLLLRTY